MLFRSQTRVAIRFQEVDESGGSHVVAGDVLDVVRHVVVVVRVLVDAGLVVAGNEVAAGCQHFADNAFIERFVCFLQTLCHLHTQGRCKRTA